MTHPEPVDDADAAWERGGWRSSKFMRGNWAPVQDETDAPVPLRVTAGQIPVEFPDGAFLRVGPNPSDPAQRTRPGYHFFSGDGMVHCVEFGGSRATYSRRFIRTANYSAGRDDVMIEADNGQVPLSAVCVLL